MPSVIRSDVRGRAMTRSAARTAMTGGTPTDPYHYKLIKDRLDIGEAENLLSKSWCSTSSHLNSYNVLFKLNKIYTAYKDGELKWYFDYINSSLYTIVEICPKFVQ